MALTTTLIKVNLLTHSLVSPSDVTDFTQLIHTLNFVMEYQELVQTTDMTTSQVAMYIDISKILSLITINNKVVLLCLMELNLIANLTTKISTT